MPPAGGGANGGRMDDLAARLLEDYERRTVEGEPPVEVVQVVGPIPEGAVIVIHGTNPEWTRPEMLAQMAESFAAVAGHERFCILAVEGAEATLMDVGAPAAEVFRRLTIPAPYDATTTRTQEGPA